MKRLERLRKCRLFGVLTQLKKHDVSWHPCSKVIWFLGPTLPKVSPWHGAPPSFDARSDEAESILDGIAVADAELSGSREV